MVGNTSNPDVGPSMYCYADINSVAGGGDSLYYLYGDSEFYTLSLSDF